MRKSFKLRLPAGLAGASAKDPRVIARAVIGILLLANLLAALAVFMPLGGSPEELEDQAVSLRQQVQQRRAQHERSRILVAKIEHARASGDTFLSSYFLSRQSTYSTLLGELDKAAKESGIRSKDRSFVIDPVEGSDTMSMMTITANYEGTYGDLLQFVNHLDKSPRFLILDTLTATPQQGSANLNVAVKMNSFVKAEPAVMASVGAP